MNSARLRHDAKHSETEPQAILHLHTTPNDPPPESISAWGNINRRPLRRVALTDAPLATDASSEQTWLDLARLWREIQDLSAHDVDAGLAHVLKRLCELASAQGARWELLGSMRPGKTVCMASQAWSDAAHDPMDGDGYGPALSLTLPIRTSVRMNFTLMRATGSDDFDSRDRTMLELVLAGLSRWLNWLALSHGPLTSAGPLPPHQRKVLLLLVTGRSEKQIAAELNLSINTAHQYVTALYRRYGVRNRPSMVALWLGAD